MRSTVLLAVVSATLVLTSACGDGAGTPPPDNTGPKADFTFTCDALVCSFTSTSTDDSEVTDWSWDFDGDGKADANTATASFTYAAANDYNVSLTVHDAQGLSDKKTSTVTVSAENTPPTAAFTFTCTATDCSFTSTSTDAAPGTIVTYAWEFGDGGLSDLSNPSHSYSVTAPTDFTVTLTVTDNSGATDVETQTVSVAPAPNTPPTAAFTSTCNAADCTFTSTSTDVAPGTIVTYAWTFGDGGTSAVNNPLHSYAITATKDFTVTLTVTDNDGATDVETQTVTVSPPPPAAEGCITSGSNVDCFLNITARSTAKLTLNAIGCTQAGVAITVPPPIGDQVFLGVCQLPVGKSLGVFGGPHDSAIIFEAGSQLRIRFKQGFVDSDEPPMGPPAAHLEGAFPNWTISYEDGANPGGAGEPDFADVVLGVEAIPRP
jgi:PKD repeat protein